jgi:hypothetical protein
MKSSSSESKYKQNLNAGFHQLPPAFNYHSIMSPGDDIDRNLEPNDIIPTPPPPLHPGVLNEPNLNLQSPPYQRVERPKAAKIDDPLSTTTLYQQQEEQNVENVKTCRICLEDDSPETMMAPCKCRGWSKWVHRDCLDEWRLQESDRAFSKCTECLFDYYIQPVYEDTNGLIHRQIKFYWNVSRDVCLGTLVLQLIIVALAGLIYACDPNQALPNQIMPVFQLHPWSLYYLLGWLLLLVFVGIYGSGVLCFNGCSVSKSLPQFRSPSTSTTPVTTQPNATPSMGPRDPPRFSTSGGTREHRMAQTDGMDSTTDFYRRARHRRQRNYHSDQIRGQYHNQNEYSCCDSCTYCCNRQPMLIYDPYGCYGCYCCDGCRYHYNDSAEHSDSECCDGSNCGGGDGGNQDCGECVHVLLIILLVFAIILAVIGFFVGIVITVVAFQRVVQRHIHLLQKKQLVQEYKVVDLQDYDLSQPLPTAPQEGDLEWNSGGLVYSKTAPSAVPIDPLPAKDVSYLQKLGLKE